MTANALIVPEPAPINQVILTGVPNSSDPDHATRPNSESGIPDTPVIAGVADADQRETFRAFHRAQRGRIIAHPEMAARLDTHRLGVDSGEHLAAVEAVHSSARRDGLATRRAFFMAQYARAHIDGLVVRRTHGQIAEDMTPFLGRDVSARTVAGLAREAHRNGLMVTLEEGLSPVAHAKLGGTGPRVPLYALTVPREVEHQLTHRAPCGKGTDRGVRDAEHTARIRGALGLTAAPTEGVDELAYLSRPAKTSPNDADVPGAHGLQEDSRTSGPVDEVAYPNLSSVGREVDSPRPTFRRDPTGPGRAPLTRRGDISNTKTTKRSSKAARLADAFAGHLVLRKISHERLARLIRPFARAGWGPADIRHALEHTPDGTQHRHSEAPRYPLSWATHRLGLWLTDGQPVTSWSQHSVTGWTWNPDSPTPAPESWEAEQAAAGPQTGAEPSTTYRAMRAASAPARRHIPRARGWTWNPAEHLAKRAAQHTHPA